MKVSIIIPSFQRSYLLKWDLLSLSKQVMPDDFETIILNDGVMDETAAACLPYKDTLRIKYLFTGQRNMDGRLVWRIPGYAINIGVKQSSGDIIILCCAEMFHINDSVRLITEPFKSAGSDKLITIPQAKDDNGRFLGHLVNTLGNFDINEYERQPKLDNVRFPFFMAMKKSSFVGIGGYDEDFIGTDFDDTDFVRRLVQSGCEYLETEAKVIHLWHARLPMSAERRPRYEYNQRLYKERESVIVRNVGKEWGVL